MTPRGGTTLRRALPAAALAGLAAALACQGRPDAFEQRLSVSAPEALREHVVWLDRTLAELVIVRPDPYQRARVAVNRRPLRMSRSPSLTHLAVLSAGDPDAADDPVPPRLEWIDAAAGRSVAAYDLQSPFDRVAIAPDDRFALCHFSQEAEDVEGVFVNPNQIALVDLRRPAGEDNPALRTLRSFGSVPLGVRFSPPLCIPEPGGCRGDARMLAAVLAEGAVTLLDLDRPDLPEVTVRLYLRGETPPVPEDVVFAPDAGTLFVRASGSADVFVIQLLPRDPEDGGEADGEAGEGEAGGGRHDWRPSLNQLGAGDDPGDLGWFDEDGARRVLVVNRGSRDVSIIDAATASFARIPVGAPVDRALLFPPEAPTTALLYATGGSARVFFLDLAGALERGARNLREAALPRAARDVVPAPGGGHALVIHDEARTVLSVIDLAARTVSPIAGGAPLTDFAFALGDTLVGVAGGQERVGFLDLGELRPWDLRLDDEPTGVSVVAGPEGPGADRVVVHHRGQAGLITVLPSVRAGAADAVRIEGFLLEGVLDARP